MQRCIPVYTRLLYRQSKYFTGLSFRCKKCASRHHKHYKITKKSTPEGLLSLRQEQRRWYESQKGKDCIRLNNLMRIQRQRQAKLNGAFDWSRAKWRLTLQAFGHKCAYCGCDGPFHQDHFIPLANRASPGTVIGNMVPACRRCNLAKAAKHPLDWIKDKGKAATIIAALESLRQENREAA